MHNKSFTYNISHGTSLFDAPPTEPDYNSFNSLSYQQSDDPKMITTNSMNQCKQKV